MKIRAVRLREVGCFSDPVAVEGFSGGLDVLAGRNELGKSTILKALRVLFAYKHTAKNGAVEQLRSYSGGTPLIEVDFETDGGIWRLRKQFLSEPQCLLSNVATKQVVARGERAHEQALQLCDGNATGLFDLLWVSQTGALEVPVPDKESRATLESALEQEISAISGSSGARVVRARAAAALEELVTRATQKPRGPYKSVIDERARIAAELDGARKAAGEAAERLNQLGQLRSRRAALLDPEAARSRLQLTTALQQRFDEAVDAQRKLKNAEAELKAATSVEAEVRRAHEVLQHDIAELKTLQDSEASTGAALDEAQAQLGKLDTCHDAGRGTRDRLRAQLKAAQGRMRAREQAERSAQAAHDLAEIERRLAQARGAIAKVADLKAAIRADPATDERMAAAEREHRAIAVLEASLEAASPKVRISYAPSPKAKLRVGGRELREGEVLSPATPIVIEIDGVGRIEIDPGLSEDVASDRADLRAHRETLGELLGIMNVPTLAEARDARDRRQALERELRQNEERLEVLAPRGVRALEADRNKLVELALPPPPSDLPARSDIEEEIARLVHDEAAAESRLEELVACVTASREAVARLAAEQNARRKRMAEIKSKLPPASSRSAHLAEARSKAFEARETLNAAVRAHAVWSESVLSDEAVNGLKAKLVKAKRDEEARESELIEVNQKLAVLDGLLERDHQDDLDAKIEELEGQLANADARVAHCQREAAALQLLLNKLDEVERHSRATFVRPIVRRMGPLLDIVLPGSRIEIDKDLRIDRVLRGADREDVRALSQGTREQISVLVRLAFGALLADSGRSAPLILDDALVYSDDVRIEALFGVLRRAAEAHQIIMLTCRSRTFQTLGGAQLSIGPWQPG